jgi:hypothetical protein
MRADHDPLAAACRTRTEAPLKWCRVGQGGSYLLNLLMPIENEVRCETRIAEGLTSASYQRVRHPVQDIHEFPTPNLCLIPYTLPG